MAAEQTDLAARPASMGKADAKRLTAQIRRQLGDVQQRSERLLEMVRRARRENAWAALGYASESQWIAAEFPDLSRGQKYRLVAWGQVVSELETATKAPVEVSGRQAAKAKKAGPSAVAEKVRQRLASIPEPTDEDRRGAVADALAEPIEATGTKVEPAAPSAAAVPLVPVIPTAPPIPAPTEHTEAPRARAVEPVDPDQVQMYPAFGTAAGLLAALITIDPGDVTGVEATDLDRLMSWIGLVRAAIRRRSAAAKPTAAKTGSPPPRAAPPAKMAPTPAPAAVKAAPKERAGVDAKPTDCAHPANRIMGGTCFACGAKVGK